jgi:PEGA domain-containing protein
VTRHTRFLITTLVCVAALWPADLFAQRAVRHPSGRRVVVVSPRYYSPYYYPRFYYPGYYGSFYDPYFFGFYGYGQYPYPYGYPSPYPYGRWAYDDTGAARLQVTPRNTKVYVDGYFAGTVDDFDGTWQRLNVESGEHDLQLYLEGYQPFSQKVLFVRGRTLKLNHAMLPLNPGESAGPPPQPDPAAATATPRTSRSYPRDADPRDRDPDNVTVRRAPQGPPRSPNRGADQSDFGSLLLRVRPQDAEVLVDGQSWNAPQGDDQLVIELAEGTHRIEVRKDGFQTYTTTVQVRRGQTVRLNVGLTAGRPGEV